MDWEPRVGMRVVCLKEGPWAGNSPYPEPKKGDVCTIRAVDLCCFGSGDIFLRFDEFVEPPIEGFEPRYWVVHFRPLDERRLDIFRAVLTKAPTPDMEPA